VITLTLRRDLETENQYRAFNSERYVGRIYQADKDHWFWAVALDVTAPPTLPTAGMSVCTSRRRRS
jgi:hypothetical protein